MLQFPGLPEDNNTLPHVIKRGIKWDNICKKKSKWEINSSLPTLNQSSFMWPWTGFEPMCASVCSYNVGNNTSLIKLLNDWVCVEFLEYYLEFSNPSYI